MARGRAGQLAAQSLPPAALAATRVHIDKSMIHMDLRTNGGVGDLTATAQGLGPHPGRTGPSRPTPDCQDGVNGLSSNPLSISLGSTLGLRDSAVPLRPARFV